VTSNGYPEAGETISHFRVGRRLGGGGMGVVFEALDTTLNRQVALKVIAADLAEDAAFRTRFTREAQAQASLDSPHVVQVYAHGEDDGRLWIASQLVPDGDLRAMLTSHGAPPMITALDLMEQVADGLAAAHRAGLVHRDIKPANVMLRRTPTGFQAYLADFGIARQVDAEATRTASSATVGTPRYMAPELHTGGQPGVASDVYSLGCLLWACLSGSAPYAGTSDFEIVTAHREQPIPQLPDQPPPHAEVNALLRATLAKDPADRPASAALVRDELARLRRAAEQEAAAPSAPPAPPMPELPADVPVAEGIVPEPARRRGGMGAVLVGLAAVLVAAAVLGWLVTRDDDDADPGASPSETTSAPPSTPTSTPSESSSASSGTYTPEQVETATTGMATAFATQQALTETQARCIAEQTIQQAGLDRLVEIGMFDESLAFTDVDLATFPDVKAALSQAVLTCATA
jgi:serine/threonine protein kinase